MWWLWSTEEEAGEEGGGEAASRSRASSRGRSRGSTNGRSRGGQSSRASVISGISSNTTVTPKSRQSRNRRNPSRKTRGRPSFPSTFSVVSGLSVESGQSQRRRRRRSADNRSGVSANTGRSSRRSRASSRSRLSRASSTSRSSRWSRRSRRRAPRSDRLSQEDELEEEPKLWERIQDSFWGALLDVQEQIQMTVAENELDSSSNASGGVDDDTVQYDNTGRISLQPANPPRSLAASANSRSHWSDYDDLIFGRAIAALRIAIFADAVNSQILGPNYALLVGDDHLDSFPTTEPFAFGAAYYFMPMCADIGMVLSSIVLGSLSDRPSVGRTRCVLMCMYLGAVGSVLKYVARHNFWTFCAANFFTGLFGGSLAVGMAYVGDIFLDRMQTDAEIGILVATNMIGRTGGGVLAIALQSVGLFEPLLVSAGISFLAGILCHIYMCDVIPYDDEEFARLQEGEEEMYRSSTSQNQSTAVPTGNALDATSSTDEFKPASSRPSQMSTASESMAMTMSCIAEEDESYPTELDPGALINVLLGELADNLGSIGLVPICLAPLMWQTFHADFVEAEPPQDPIMSATSYKWIYVFIALIVIPGAVLAPILFAKMGPALCAVLANLLTGAVTIILLQIANIDPPTYATYCIFVTVLYTAFPLTVISQLSTGPMLDRIAPLDQRGQIQGLNMAAMNTATALGPFLYGILADATSIDITLYVTSGVCVLAAVINYQMVGDERFGPQPEEDDNDFYEDGDEMSGMDPSSALPSRSPGSILPSTATRSVASLAHDLHVEFLPSFF